MTEIKGNAFFNCKNLTSATIQGNGLTLAAAAFANCERLTSVTIVEGVAEIDGGAFLGCNALAEIFVAEENPNYKSVDGVLFTKDGKILLAYPPALRDNEDYQVLEGVTVIERAAFSSARIRDVTFPERLTVIKREAFYNCRRLETLFFPESLIEIGRWALGACHHLKDSIIPLFLPK